MKFTAKQIAEYLGGEVEGNENAAVHEFAKIEEGRAGALSFLANPKYEHYVYETLSTIVIVSTEFAAAGPVAATLVRVADPYAAFAGLLRMYDAARPRPVGISERASVAADAIVGADCYVGDFAVVSSGAVLGDGVLIFPQAFVGAGVKVGAGTVLNAGVKVYEGCVIGAGVTIHAGAVIGADGFGFAPEGSEYAKIPQIGNVIIEDNVEIGANTCVDRATMGSTVIRRGAKLDNLIQVGHNVEIGAGTVVAAQAGMAGSSKLGRGCMIGGQVGLAGHLTLGDGVKMGAQSGIDKDVPAGEILLGSPAMPVRKFHRSWAIFRNLPELVSRVNELERKKQ